jgi:hypothetical protein
MKDGRYQVACRCEGFVHLFQCANSPNLLLIRRNGSNTEEGKRLAVRTPCSDRITLGRKNAASPGDFGTVRAPLSTSGVVTSEIRWWAAAPTCLPVRPDLAGGKSSAVLAGRHGVQTCLYRGLEIMCQCEPLQVFATQVIDSPMKKAANCMSLAAFVMRYGGAGGI